MKRNEFVDHLCEQLAPMGSLRSRAMFGGWSLYCDELIFAIVVDEVLYLKADAETTPRFDAEGCGPFEYQGKDGKTQSMNYYRLPDEALEDRHALLQWCRSALAVSLRAKAKTPGKQAPKAKPSR